MDASEARDRLAFFTRLTLAQNLFTPVPGFATRLPYECARLVRDAWQLYLERVSLPVVSLYVHVPFCANGKCRFCMYHSTQLVDQHQSEAYLAYLAHCAEYFAPVFHGCPLESLYIGGGTPSVLTLRQLDALFDRVVGCFQFQVDAERTFEQSFITSSREKLRLLRQRGINRLSFGLESVEERVLAAVGRAGAGEQRVRDLVGEARVLGFEEVNLDLLIGLQHETEAGVVRGFERAVEAGAHCVTVYVYRHREQQAGDALNEYNRVHVPRMLRAIREAAARLSFLATGGSDHTDYQFFTPREHIESYRLRTYRTRPDSRCGNSTLGLGHTAYSFIDDFFRAECRDSDASFDPENATWVVETIGREDRRRLFVIETLYREGSVDDCEFKALFGEGLAEVFPVELAALRSLGRLAVEGERFGIAAEDRLEQAALSKFFWSQQYLDELARGVE